MKITKLYSIISETVQAMSITFAVKIVRPTYCVIFSPSDDLALHPRSQLRLKRDKCFTCTIIAISRTVVSLSYGIQTWHVIYNHAHARVDNFDLDAKVTVGRQRPKISIELSRRDN